MAMEAYLDSGPYSGQALLEAARSLAPQIAAAADEIERERHLPFALVVTLKDAGLYRMLVPSSVGGAELTLREFAEVVAEIARADASVAWCIAQNSGICGVSGYMPPEGLREIFGKSDMNVSWGNGPQTALKVPGGYRLSGRWSFSSGIRNAVWSGAHNAPVVDERGEPVLDASGAQRQVTMFFPVEDIELTDVWQVSGLRGTGSDSYTVTDLFVPDRRVAFEEPQVPGPLYRFGTTNIFSIGFAAVGLGLARGAQQALHDLATTKSPRGIEGALAGQQYAQMRLAQAEGTLRSTRLFLLEEVDRVWNNVATGSEFDLEARIDLRLATTYTIQRSAEVVDNAYQLAGSTAIFTDKAFERRFRDMHAVTQHIQARDDHYERVGRYLLGLEPDRGWL
jgi:alkylation response protein AidB-like acyl-CoA dehydrogenase